MEVLVLGGWAYLTRSEWAWYQFSDLPEQWQEIAWSHNSYRTGRIPKLLRMFRR